MADPSGDSERDRAPDADAGTPRWVIAFGVVGAILVIAFIVLHLTGNTFRGH